MKRVLLILMAIVYSIVSIGASSNKATAEPFDSEKYVETAKEIAEAFYECATDAGNILNYEANFANNMKKLGGNYKPEDGYSKGIDFFNKNSEKTWEESLAKRDEALEKYKKLIKIDVSSDAFCSEIREKMKTLFESYNDMFHTMENPSVAAMSEAGKQMRLFVKTYDVLAESYF